jgi:hypothetical protein
MHTPVFIDHLPDAALVSGRKSQVYRLLRNQSLINILLDETLVWYERDCPGCGQPVASSKTFGQAFMPFQRCTACNTIYARRVPSQSMLDGLRRALTPIRDAVVANEDHRREFEFVSLLNWVSLTDARLPRDLKEVLDYRYCSQAPGWEPAVKRLSHSRHWTFVPLSAEAGEDFSDLTTELQRSHADAVMVLAEMDRAANPAKLLEAIRDNTPKGTFVFIASSCADGLEYELLGASSPSFIPLDRLTVFSIRGLDSLAKRLGFKVHEMSTPGRLDAVILAQHFNQANNTDVPFWSGFFRDADNDRLHDLQTLLQRSLRSGFLRFILET